MPAVRVRLVTPDVRLLDAALYDRPALARALDCRLAENWEVVPHALRQTRDAVAADPASVRWGPRLVILVDRPSVLVGWCGFKGPPRDGLVEIRYAVAPGSRGRGVATAAVRELAHEAFSAAEVNAILARTEPAPNPSARVLTKVGFVHEGEVADDEMGYAWRFRYDRGRA